MKVSEIKKLSNEQLLVELFYMGVQMCGGKSLKKDELTLERMCKDCERRGFVKDGEHLYWSMCQ